jgi:diguanylate cyclase (GGDEF)-like protein
MSVTGSLTRTVRLLPISIVLAGAVSLSATLHLPGLRGDDVRAATPSVLGSTIPRPSLADQPQLVPSPPSVPLPSPISSLLPTPTVIPTDLPLPTETVPVLPTSTPGLLSTSTPSPQSSNLAASPSPDPSGVGTLTGTGSDGKKPDSGGPDPNVPTSGKAPLVLSLALPGGPLGVGLAVTIAVLPLLAGLLLLLVGRLWGEARRMNSSRLRLALASDLEIKPRELAALSTPGLLKLRDQVAFDDLTGVLRRVAGIASLDREIHRARRSKTELATVFIDLDGLKRVNDFNGHAAGDELIRGVARLLQEGLRKEDLIFRYGGDEFVCVLPGIDLEVADTKLRDLRAKGASRQLLFSFGTAALSDEDDMVSLLGRADQALYDGRARREQDLGGQARVLPLLPLSGARTKRSRGPKSIL